MNIKQRWILIAVAAFITGMMLYPPYYTPALGGLYGSSSTHRYDWLLSAGDGRVEVELLLAQFFVVAVIGSIAYFLCADKNQADKKSN